MNKVLIAVPTMEYGRQGIFYDYYNLIQKEPGTILSFSRGQSPAANRNVLIEGGLQSGCTHILFIDDDVLVPPDILPKLLRHDKDIVTGLYLMRQYPHKPIIFDFSDDKGHCRNYYPKDSEDSLIEIINCGLGAVLIKMEVFRAIEKPWITLGELDPQNWCDDIAFFNKCKAFGFKMYCDLSVVCGHIASAAVWPEHKNGQWWTKYDTFGSGHVYFPAVRPEHARSEGKPL